VEAYDEINTQFEDLQVLVNLPKKIRILKKNWMKLFLNW
jgi:hypothetical protein